MSYTTMWEVTDNTGTIHSGTEDEMKIAFTVMQNHHNLPYIQDYCRVNKTKAKKLIKEYNSNWIGDLRLIQIHDVTR